MALILDPIHPAMDVIGFTEEMVSSLMLEKLMPKTQRLLPSVLAFLEHVFDGGLVDNQVGGAVAIQFDAGLVVPLNDAVHFLTVAQHYTRLRLGLHLLLVIRIFGVGL